MFGAAIRQNLFHQNDLRENLPEFNDVKVTHYTVTSEVHNIILIIINFNFILCTLGSMYGNL